MNLNAITYSNAMRDLDEWDPSVTSSISVQKKRWMIPSGSSRGLVESYLEMKGKAELIPSSLYRKSCFHWSYFLSLLSAIEDHWASAVLQSFMVYRMICSLFYFLFPLSGMS